MKSQFKSVWHLLSKKERLQLLLVSVLSTLAGLTDMIGVASIFPFLSVAANPEIINTNVYLIAIKNWIQIPDKQFIMFLGLISLTALLVNQLKILSLKTL